MPNRATRRASATGLVLSLLSLAACGGEPVELVDTAEAAGPDIVQLTAEQLDAAGLVTEVTRHQGNGTPRRVPGTVITPDTALSSIGSVVEGRVGRVQVLAGDRVAAGAELMRVHSHELTDAIRDRESADAQLTYYRSALERSRLLLEAGAVSREEVDRRAAEYEAAAAESRRSTEWVRHLTPSPEGDVVVRAPRAGVVFAVHARPGAVVTPGSPLIEIGSTEVLWVQGFVPENSAVRLETGSPVAVRFQSLPGTEVQGRIVRMGEVIDPVRRAVDVRVELNDVPPAVRPGMYATLVIPGPEGAPRALLPAEAVQRMGGGEVVFLQEASDRFRAVRVNAHPQGDGMLAVEGVPEGAEIVTRGAYTLRSMLEGIEVE